VASGCADGPATYDASGTAGNAAVGPVVPAPHPSEVDMKARHLLSTLVLPFIAVVLTAGCEGTGPTAVSAVEQSPAPLSAAVDLPFAFSLTGHANPDFSQGPCNVTNVESGTGIALHLGVVTWSSEESVSFCVDPADP